MRNICVSVFPLFAAPTSTLLSFYRKFFKSSTVLLQPPEDNEEEDFKILPTENLLVVGRADDEFSSIEVHGEEQLLLFMLQKIHNFSSFLGGGFSLLLSSRNSAHFVSSGLGVDGL